MFRVVRVRGIKPWQGFYGSEGVHLVLGLVGFRVCADSRTCILTLTGLWD